MSSVRAFQPRQYDPPKFVAENIDDLPDLVGSFIGGGQCDGCGNHSYLVVATSHGYVAKCEVDPGDDPEFAHPDPCGAAYPINVWDEDLVEF